MQIVVIPVLAFAAVIICAVLFGMFLHLMPHTVTPLVALAATLAVTIGAFVASAGAGNNSR